MQLKQYILLFIILFNIGSTYSSQSRIKVIPLDTQHAQQTKLMIISVLYETIMPHISLEQFTKDWDVQDEFDDFIDIDASYFKKSGLFLVAYDQEAIIGSGAIKKLNNEACELTRFYLLKEYRGKGIGLSIAQQLLAWAKDRGYKKVRLEMYYPKQQHAALALYKKLGFYSIDAYSNNPAELWMEKVL